MSGAIGRSPVAPDGRLAHTAHIAHAEGRSASRHTWPANRRGPLPSLRSWMAEAARRKGARRRGSGTCIVHCAARPRTVLRLSILLALKGPLCPSPLCSFRQHLRSSGEGEAAHDVSVPAAARAPVLMWVIPAVLWLETRVEVIVDAPAARAVPQCVPDVIHVRHLCASHSLRVRGYAPRKARSCVSTSFVRRVLVPGRLRRLASATHGPPDPQVPQMRRGALTRCTTSLLPCSSTRGPSRSWPRVVLGTGACEGRG